MNQETKMQIFTTYKKAVFYVESNYWVEGFTFAPTKTSEQQEQVFDRLFFLKDESESGLQHWGRRYA